MPHLLPTLDFATDALAPFLSAETFAYHYEKHHRAYVTNLNTLVAATDLEGLSLTELLQQASGPVFNNAAQHYNHSFYWRCIAPGGPPEPSGELRNAIDRDFGSLKELAKQFSAAAKTHFGSGWCWIVRDADGHLAVRTSANADSPCAEGQAPVLTCDVWEHAYYIDYRNDRATYVTAFWERVNWDFVALAYSTPEGVEEAILRV